MHYAVPQFIEVEDKIIGPLTMRQFLWLLLGGGIIFIFYFVLTTPALVVVAIPIGGISAGLAFLRIHNMSLGGFLFEFVRFSLTPQIFLWKRATGRPTGEKALDEKIVFGEAPVPPEELHEKPRPAVGHLRRLAWELDIKGETSD